MADSTRKNFDLSAKEKEHLQNIANVLYAGNMQSVIRRYVVIGLRLDAATLNPENAARAVAFDFALPPISSADTAELKTTTLLLRLKDETWAELSDMASEIAGGTVNQLIHRYIAVGLRLDWQLLATIDTLGIS